MKSKRAIPAQVEPVVRWRSSSFGQFASFDLPPGVGLVLVGFNRFGDHPLWLLLPGQVYRKKIREILKSESGIENFFIYPIRHEERIEISLNSI
jgi:hypothetical protein